MAPVLELLVGEAMTEAMTEAEAMIEAMTEALRGNDLNKAEEKRLKRNEQAKMMRERRGEEIKGKQRIYAKY
jgi:hypothetical protein